MSNLHTVIVPDFKEIQMDGQIQMIQITGIMEAVR